MGTASGQGSSGVEAVEIRNSQPHRLLSLDDTAGAAHLLGVRHRVVLDGMDFMIYPLVIGTIMALWHVDAGTAGLAATVTLLASALGGWLAGFVADRIGRVLTLQITILWFSLFSLLCALVQNFEQLLVARAILGLGFGGEWAAGAVLIGETIRAEYRGRAVGSVQSGWAIGWSLWPSCRRRCCSRSCRPRPRGAGCSRSAPCRPC